MPARCLLDLKLMQIARYLPVIDGADTDGSRRRRQAVPVERVLEGGLLRGERREGRERRTPPEQSVSESVTPPGPDFVPPPVAGSRALVAYLRAADPLRFTPPSRLHVLA